MCGHFRWPLSNSLRLKTPIPSRLPGSSLPTTFSTTSHDLQPEHSGYMGKDFFTKSLALRANERRKNVKCPRAVAGELSAPNRCICAVERGMIRHFDFDPNGPPLVFTLSRRALQSRCWPVSPANSNHADPSLRAAQTESTSSRLWQAFAIRDASSGVSGLRLNWQAAISRCPRKATT